MQFRSVLLLLSFLALVLVGCNKFFSEEGKSAAQTLTAEGKWVVDAPKGGGITSGSRDCGDCLADIVLSLKSTSSNKQVSMCIDSSNSQFAEYAKLKGGDVVSFVEANNPTQKECGSGAFVILKK